MNEQKTVEGLPVERIVHAFADGKEKVLLKTGRCVMAQGGKILYNMPLTQQEEDEIKAEKDREAIREAVADVLHGEFEAFKRELLAELLKEKEC